MLLRCSLSLSLGPWLYRLAERSHTLETKCMQGTCSWAGTSSLGWENRLLREDERIHFVQLMRPSMKALGREGMGRRRRTRFASVASTAILPLRILVGPPLPPGHQYWCVSREKAQGPDLTLGLLAPVIVVTILCLCILKRKEGSGFSDKEGKWRPKRPLVPAQGRSGRGPGSQCPAPCPSRGSLAAPPLTDGPAHTC